MKRWLYVLIPLAILSVLIAWRIRAKRVEAFKQTESREARKKAPVSVAVAPAQVRDLVQTFEAVGNVESPDNVKLAPKVAGRVASVFVRMGDPVTVGQVLARIDPSEIEAQVRQQQANVAEAQYRLSQAQVVQGSTNVGITTQIQQQQAALASAQADYNQARENYGAQVAAANAAVTDAQGRLKNAAAAIASAQADSNQARENYGAQQAAAQAAVADAEGRVKNANAGVASVQADFNQVRENYNSQVAAAEAAVTDVEGRVSSANAAIANAQAGIRSAQANLDNARTKYNRTYDLYKQGFIAAQDVDNAKTEVSVQQGALDVARGQLDAATAQRDSALAEKKAAQHQADIVKTKGQADIEAARAKVTQAQAVLESAQAQKEAAQHQADIVKTKGKADIEAARAKVTQAQAGQESAAAQKKVAQQQASIVGTKGKADIEAAHQKAVQAQAALAAATANTSQKAAYGQSLAALQASVSAAQAMLRGAQAQLADTVLRSPVKGFVTARYLDEGSVATAGQAVVNVQAVRQLWVTVTVPEEVSHKIRFGQSATVKLDALPGRTFVYPVVAINPAADPQSRQFTVRLGVNNAQNLFKPGLFAHVKLEVERVRGAVVVPREAVQKEAEGTFVVVVKAAATADATDTAERRPVLTGASDAGGIAITSGVQRGERVVTLSAVALKDGQAVRVQERKKGGKGGGKPGKGEPGKGEPGKGEPEGGKPQETPQGAAIPGGAGGRP